MFNSTLRISSHQEPKRAAVITHAAYKSNTLYIGLQTEILLLLLRGLAKKKTLHVLDALWLLNSVGECNSPSIPLPCARNKPRFGSMVIHRVRLPSDIARLLAHMCVKSYSARRARTYTQDRSMHVGTHVHTRITEQ